MGNIKIELGDWLKNAGVIGLLKVLESKSENINDIIKKQNYIEFDLGLLEGFEEAYFKLLIEENESQLSWYKLTNKEELLLNLSKKEIIDKDLDLLNKTIDEFKIKLTSNSYKSAYLLINLGEVIASKEKQLKKIKLKKNDSIKDFKKEIDNQINLLLEIIDLLNKKEVKKVIAAKNVMYDIIQPFWTNISFLLKTNNKNDMYELYKKDFIEPTKNYIEKDKKNLKYNCFTCENKILKLGKPEAFELGWIVKTGVDMSRKSSHFWNMNGDAYICPICNLVYSCIPLGFIILKGKGLFINNNQNINLLKQSNIVNEGDRDSFEEIENYSYYNILKVMEQKHIENIDKEFENIQVVKIDSNNNLRPYSFNILSPRIMKLLFYHRNSLNRFIKIKVKITDKYYINIYDEIIKRIYEGKNLFDLIHQLIIMNLDKKFKNLNLIFLILEINSSLIGGKNMRIDDIRRYKNYGKNLREIYKNKGAESKLIGITYRLLNAIKTNDSGKYMDSLINSYMYMKLEIPGDLSLALVNNDMLQSIGYAFVLGLQGEILNKNSEEEKENK